MRKKHVHYREGKRLKKSRLQIVGLVVAILLIGAGLYLLMLLRAPDVKPLNAAAQEEFVPSEIANSRVIIPKIAVNAEINAGDAWVLNKGAWHRFPERGDPVEGGNFIVSGHRFVSARTPQLTKEHSYFYNIDKLQVGDEILIDWKHQRYKYEITEVKTVTPTQTEIEAPSDDAKLTLYTCTLKGDKDGRVVLIAKPKTS